jgi:hypothetical protein
VLSTIPRRIWSIPDLVRCQVQVAKHAAERLARVDPIQELLTQLDR